MDLKAIVVYFRKVKVSHNKEMKFVSNFSSFV